jgi:hypothetical protein
MFAQSRVTPERCSQALLALALIHDLKNFFVRLQTLLEEREHDFVFIFPAMEERADMTAAVHRGPCKCYLLGAVCHLSLLR